MDYKKIVFFGIVESHSQESRIQYLKRKYKDAEGKHYTVNEFFNGCINAINLYESEISSEIWFWRKDHTDMLKRWEGNNHDPNRKQNAIKKLKEELSKLDVKTYKIKVELSNNNNEIKKTRGYVSNNDLNTMRNSIEEVRSNLEPKKKNKPKPTDIEPLNFELNQSEVIYLFDILQEAGFLYPPKFQDGSYYRKLETYFSAKKTPIKDAEQKRNKFTGDNKPLSTAENIREKLIEAIQKIPY